VGLLRSPPCSDQRASLLFPAFELHEEKRVKARELEPKEGGVGAISASRQTLFVISNERGDGFHGSVRGHLLELADPTDPVLAPTPDDLLVASIASDIAWFARRFLRTYEFDDYLSVSGRWTLGRPPELGKLDLTVAVPQSALSMRETLAAALESRLAARRFSPPQLHVLQT
jgi:hypothetical protein